MTWSRTLQEIYVDRINHHAVRDSIVQEWNSTENFKSTLNKIKPIQHGHVINTNNLSTSILQDAVLSKREIRQMEELVDNVPE